MVEFRDVIKRYAAEGEAVGVADGEVDGLPVVQAIVAGANVTVDDTDPARPVISATGGGGGGAVDSVNGKTGVVVLNYEDVGAASAAQGSLADTAVQPAALASGLAGKQDADPALDALSGADVEAWGRSWLDLASQAAARSRLGLGTAAVADTGDFATAAQGALAESAVQPGALAAVATSGDYTDLTGAPTLGTAAGMSPVEVVTDSAAQASLSSTFVRHVRWTGSAWPARPVDAEFVIFVSTHDASATAPNDINLAAGDYWLRHPEAV